MKAPSNRRQSARKRRNEAAKIGLVRRRLLEWAAATANKPFLWREPLVPPFHVLVSEILLARTRAEAVDPVARKLLARFSTPRDVAAAPVRQIERLLRPLGLHRTRARLLKRCAAAIVSDYAGNVPQTVDLLMSLPHVGQYAANSVACVSFGASAAVLDANVARIYQRVFGLPQPRERITDATWLWEFAARVLPKERARDYNWALLDLGRAFCKPRTPVCETCPLRGACSSAS
jgi:A/G-specific adenine glycosylase